MSAEHGDGMSRRSAEGSADGSVTLRPPREARTNGRTAHRPGSGGRVTAHSGALCAPVIAPVIAPMAKA